MAKSKKQYACTACGATTPQWSGQCSACQAWNTLEEQVPIASGESANPRVRNYAGSSGIVTLDSVEASNDKRTPTGISELDRVLGGGVVEGSVTLLGGDPGIGKSTLLLQALASLTQGDNCLYVSGEESLHQISMRAQRLAIQAPSLKLVAETQVERIIDLASSERPSVVVIDSIQTMHTELLQSAPGSVAQVRESAAQLVRFAKQSNTALLLVGHVTKDGQLAGPRVLEHMVDSVLSFEGDTASRYRVVRAIKNRFGAVNELGVFVMAENGLQEVTNPSAIFLSRHEEPVSGSVIMVTREGTRPLLVEVQALVDESHLGNPRRVTLGLEQNRLAMLLAVLHRHGGIAMFDQDVFVNVVGGMRVTETASDLAVVMAALSSLRNQPLPSDLVVFGELGLAGEIRPVPNGEERLKTAAKHGFKRAIIPKANAPKSGRIDGLQLIPITRIAQIFDHL
ncbi:DNA repair protein RadA [gamma proteobacterium HTCC5015]|nr:DNA repair protein RadA [gamma proteobacterium HTCC5015]